MHTKKIYTLLSTVALLSLPSSADAAGFYLQEQSISGQGNAYAGQAAKVRDSSIVYFNPAGMTELESNSAAFGAHALDINSKITDTGTTNGLAAVGSETGNPYDLEVVPNFSMAYQVDDKIWLGVSAGAPFGLASDYGTEWFGRYDSTDTDLKVYEIQPSIAYKVNDKLSVGGGINIQRAEAELGTVVNTGSGDWKNTLEGDDSVSFGYNIGFIYEPVDGTTLGAHYRSSVHHKLDGESDTSTFAGTSLSRYDATVDLTLPDILTLGLDQVITDKWSVQLGASWFGWNNFDEIRVVDKTGVQSDAVVTQNYQTTWAFNVGAEYILNDQWTLRGGYQFDQTPTTDEYRTTRTPGGDRHWFATGATYEINDSLALDIAVTYITISEENIDLSRNSNQVNIQAHANQDIGIASLGLTYKF